MPITGYREADPWTNGLIGTVPGAARIHTGIHSGYVAVRVGTLEHPLPVLTKSWDAVVEAPYETTTGQVFVSEWGGGPVVGLPSLVTEDQDTYRLRVHAKGRDIARDLVVREPASIIASATLESSLRTSRRRWQIDRVQNRCKH
jgi:hypothetical protein